MSKFQHFFSQENLGGVDPEDLQESLKQARKNLSKPELILIAHRGNLNGSIPERENHPDYILEALEEGFNVEIDVWYDNGFWLGHDRPQYPIDYHFGKLFLEDDRLWCHAKNFEALKKMLMFKNIHSFWHQSDDYVLTSSGFIWTYPGKSLSSRSINVRFDRSIDDTRDRYEICAGICSDYIKYYR